MTETVFCEQCGVATSVSASFCASCGSAQMPAAVSPTRTPPLTRGRDLTDETSGRVSAAEHVASPPESASHQATDEQGPSPTPQPRPPSAPGPVGVSRVVPVGRLSRAIAQARQQGDSQVVASFWLGWSSFGSALIGLLAKSSALYSIGVVIGIIAIVTARFARQRAQAANDVDLVYLSRYGQITGWIVVGLLLAVLLFIAAFFGSFLGSFGH
jgi:hypothetical protein